MMKKLKKMRKKKLSDLAGRWKMSDEEAQEFMRSIGGRWKRWKVPSAPLEK